MFYIMCSINKKKNKYLVYIYNKSSDITNNSAQNKNKGSQIIKKNKLGPINPNRIAKIGQAHLCTGEENEFH